MKRKNNIIGIIQARMGSVRLPGKTMKLMMGKPMLQIILENIEDSKYIDNYIIATSKRPENKQIIQLCKKLDVDYYAGSEQDVLSRFENISEKYNADYIIRLTGDNPFVDNTLIDEIIKTFLSEYKDFDYVNNIENSGYPFGLFVEIISREALKKLKNNKNKLDREHVTRYFRKKGNKFKVATINTKNKFKYNRLTVDTLDDFKFAEKLMYSLNRNAKKFTFKDFYIV